MLIWGWFILFHPGLTSGWAQETSPPANPAAAPVVVPFEFRRGQIMVPARVNEDTPLSFMLDTGYSLTMLNPEHAEKLNLRRAGRITIVGIAGEEKADMFAGAHFDFSGATYSPPRVASLPSQNRRRGRDGILGSGFFKRFVVEIDPLSKQLTLHEPKTWQYNGQGEVLPLDFPDSTPVVEATINAPDHPPVKARFEVDTGCDGGCCVGRDFVEAHPWLQPAGQTRDQARFGVGGSAKTTEGLLPPMQLGRLVIARPAANFFKEGSPVDAGLAGHIGLEILRPFKVIFDYSRRQMILEPSPAAPRAAP